MSFSSSHVAPEQLTVEAVDADLDPALTQKWNNKTKPVGSLGTLEKLASQVGRIQRSLQPNVDCAEMLVFAADHGIAQAGVSAFPAAVTQQMVLNFLNGGAAVNILCNINGMSLRIVDAGVNADFEPHPHLVDAKIDYGTRNILTEPAMTPEQCHLAVMRGAEQAQAARERGARVLALGEMGIGNTSAAALLVHRLTHKPVSECVGRGTGLDEAGYQRKLALLAKAAAQHDVSAEQPLAVLQCFGGFEIAMMVGAYLQGAKNQQVLLVDGFIATAALLVASRLQPAVLDYCVFTHCSGEQGHKPLLDWLQVQPLLSLDMRLGEGSGAAAALPLLRAAVALLNQMASFEDAQVSREAPVASDKQEPL